MYIPKRYGQSKIDECPFCKKRALTMNSQGIPVCNDHKDERMKDMRCACGSWLTQMKGKFGIFYNCVNCGNVNLRKALEINGGVGPNIVKTVPEKKQEQAKPNYKAVSETKKEITITADELDFYFD